MKVGMPECTGCALATLRHGLAGLRIAEPIASAAHHANVENHLNSIFMPKGRRLSGTPAEAQHILADQSSTSPTAHRLNWRNVARIRNASENH